MEKCMFHIVVVDADIQSSINSNFIWLQLLYLPVTVAQYETQIFHFKVFIHSK